MIVSVGTLSPRSMNPTYVALIPAASASCSCVKPRDSRRRRTAAPNFSPSGRRDFLDGTLAS